jgi:hypothetical protein
MPEEDHDRDVDRLDRRIDKVEQDLRVLDQQGSRGVVGLQAQVQGLAGTIGEIKGGISGLRTEVATEIKLVKSGRWQIVAAVTTIMTPVYAGVAYNFLHK